MNRKQKVSVRQELGKLIASHRKLCGLTQKKLAELVGEQRDYIRQLERGAIKRPDVFVMQQLARRFGVTVNHLLLKSLINSRNN
jgi:transcriptional regulator with XRE-family HTH domain